MMLDRNSWHARMYLWYIWQKRFVKPDFVNLCPYVRTVFLWAPLRWIFWSGRIKGFPVSIITYTILAIEIPRWLGMVDYRLKEAFWNMELCILGVATSFTLLGGLFWLWAIKLGWGNPFRSYESPKVISKTRDLVRTFFRSIHDKVCPQIKFTANSTVEPWDE